MDTLKANANEQNSGIVVTTWNKHNTSTPENTRRSIGIGRSILQDRSSRWEEKSRKKNDEKSGDQRVKVIRRANIDIDI